MNGRRRLRGVLVTLAALGCMVAAPATPAFAQEVDLRGPCDEAEHANDPRCTGTVPPATGGGTIPGGVDISGPCDEPEHANDPRCAGTPPLGGTPPTGGTTPGGTTPGGVDISG